MLAMPRPTRSTDPARRQTVAQVARAETLMAWERAPGQAVYLGGASEELEWQIQAKASWVFCI
jgi:hypothetical protein